MINSHSVAVMVTEENGKLYKIFLPYFINILILYITCRKRNRSWYWRIWKLCSSFWPPWRKFQYWCQCFHWIYFLYLEKINPSKTKVEPKDYLRNGNDIVASGYCLYGSSVHLLLALKDSVNGFTLDPALGEFILT